MGWFRTALLWLFDACKAKVETDALGDVDERLSKIERKLERIEKSPLPIGLFCSGLPVMMIGLTGMIDSLIQNGYYHNADYFYWFIGMGMVATGLRMYYRREKEAIVLIVSSAAVLIAVVVIRIFLPSP